MDLKQLVRRVIPVRGRHRLLLWKARLTQWPPAGGIRFGSLRRLDPVNRQFGFGRGRPVDRYYIEAFLARHAGDIRGRVLEVGDDAYTRRFGNGRVTASDVLHAVAGNPQATLVADLSQAGHLPEGQFDCIICTQTLQYIYDVRAAVRTLHRILKPGGVLLASLPGIGQISRYDMDRWGEYWRFTTLSVRRLLEEAFPPSGITAQAHGNVLAAVALLHGIAAEEVHAQELDHRDRDYEVLVTVRAVKSKEASHVA